MAISEIKHYIRTTFRGAIIKAVIGCEVIFEWKGKEYIYDIDTGSLMS